MKRFCLPSMKGNSVVALANQISSPWGHSLAEGLMPDETSQVRVLWLDKNLRTVRTDLSSEIRMPPYLWAHWGTHDSWGRIWSFSCQIICKLKSNYNGTLVQQLRQHVHLFNNLAVQCFVLLLPCSHMNTNRSFLTIILLYRLSQLLKAPEWIAWQNPHCLNPQNGDQTCMCFKCRLLQLIVAHRAKNNSFILTS